METVSPGLARSEMVLLVSRQASHPANRGNGTLVWEDRLRSLFLRAKVMQIVSRAEMRSVCS